MAAMGAHELITCLMRLRCFAAGVRGMSRSLSGGQASRDLLPSKLIQSRLHLHKGARPDTGGSGAAAKPSGDSIQPAVCGRRAQEGSQHCSQPGQLPEQQTDAHRQGHLARPGNAA